MTTALGISRVWATVGHGVLNEVYWPSTGQPRLRDLTFYLVSSDGSARTWIDLKRARSYRLDRADPALPLLTIRHEGTRSDMPYALELEIVPDTDRDTLLIRYAVTGPWTLVAIMAPHLDGDGADMTAWTDGTRELIATGRDVAVCLASDSDFSHASVGFAGVSDGWQDLNRNGRLTWAHTCAERGNVALTGALSGDQGVLALAFAPSEDGARTLARSALAGRFPAARDRFRDQWRSWTDGMSGFDAGPPIETRETTSASVRDAMLMSTSVLKSHEDRTYPGALVASLSTPWGSSTNTAGGYHLVWPRDTVLTAFAFIAMGLWEDAVRILGHLVATQQPDGHWWQNAYPSGEAFWTGIQLDEAAFPVLLTAKLSETGCALPEGTGAMVRRALGFVARNGPSSGQDRWEENAGINTFTVGVCIAGLVAGLPWLDAAEAAEASDLADDWCERIEEWCHVEKSRWTGEVGVSGHYIRIAPPDGGKAGTVRLGNRNGETIAAADLVAMEFSYLSRLGLRADDDPRIVETLRVVDHALAFDTPSGKVYHRYNEDGYGEHADGSPYDGAGIGRGWPFLVGERGHLALGLGASADPYLATMLACSSAGGLMPEQVWDRDAIPECNLFPGRPSGSAMPLLWTHAEFVKLAVARRDGTPVERLACVAARYATPAAPDAGRWRTGTPREMLVRGRALIVEDAGPFTLHFGLDGWAEPVDRIAEVGPFGLWRICIPADEIGGASRIVFTRRYGDAWEGRDHVVTLTDAPLRG